MTDEETVYLETFFNENRKTLVEFIEKYDVQAVNYNMSFVRDDLPATIKVKINFDVYTEFCYELREIYCHDSIIEIDRLLKLPFYCKHSCDDDYCSYHKCLCLYEAFCMKLKRLLKYYKRRKKRDLRKLQRTYR